MGAPFSLDQKTVEGLLCEALPGGKVRCYACGHRCLIFEGKRGICQVRFNREGKLRAPFGYVSTMQCDPVEKKPFFHVLPGSRALTFGMLGCDYHCFFCQNWNISQSLRDPNSTLEGTPVTPEEISEAASETGARLIVSSYNEPLITAEWAAEVFRVGRKAGFKTAFVSNGNATPQVLDFLRPHTDAYKVDLKSMREENYRKVGGKLSTVLETIPLLREKGFWVEIVTLVIPGHNDSDEELKDAARFIASVSPEIPWHVTAFHKDYRMTDPDNTPVSTLIRAAGIGREAGLKFVYAGNIPGRVGEWENTLCPSCGKLLVERSGFRVLGNLVTAGGICPACNASVPGIWSFEPAGPLSPGGRGRPKAG